MKLHVGCGPKKLDGYMHLDIVKFPHVDFCCPAWDVPVDNNHFEEIYSRHLLEHFYPWEAQDAVREWARILTHDGVLKIILPDLAYTAKQLLLGGMSKRLPTKTNYEHAMAGLYGWVRKDKPFMAHHWGYTKQSLTDLVGKHFADIVFVDCETGDLSIEARGKR